MVVLPAPLGPSSAKISTLVDGQADALDGLKLAVRLAQLVDDDGAHGLRAYSAAAMQLKDKWPCLTCVWMQTEPRRTV